MWNGRHKDITKQIASKKEAAFGGELVRLNITGPSEQGFMVRDRRPTYVWGDHLYLVLHNT